MDQQQERGSPGWEDDRRADRRHRRLRCRRDHAVALDGSEYEIDLSKKHVNELRDILKPYVKAARKADGSRDGRRGGTGSRKPVARDREQVKTIRDWARQQGLKVSERGRISREIERAYNEVS